MNYIKNIVLLYFAVREPLFATNCGTSNCAVHFIMLQISCLRLKAVRSDSNQLSPFLKMCMCVCFRAVSL